MRPLELHLKNFRSFAGDASFDFRNRRLVGIVGPIGSGKSSILDGISYGLFARTPRVAAAVRDLIHQRSDTAVVQLTFEVDGDTWQVARSIRKSQSSHTLYRLDAAGERVETITQKADVNARIEELLGLDFAGFSRSVLLAQGRFAEFLTAQPAQRDRVLKGVFGHERIDSMRQSAKQRSAELALDVEKLTGRLEGIEVAEQRLAEHKANLDVLSGRLQQLEKAQPRVADHDQRLAVIVARLATIEKRVAVIAERGQHLPAPDVVAGIVEEVQRAGSRRAELADSLEVARANVEAAEAELSKLEAAADVIDRAAALLTERSAGQTKLTERTTRRAAIDVTLAGLEAERVSAIEARAAGDEQAAVAEEALAAVGVLADEARTRLDIERHVNMAHTLRGELAVGEPCPVCARDVATIPPGDDVGEVADAQAALAATLDEQAVARGVAQSMRTAAAARRQQVEDLEQRCELTALEQAAIAGAVATTTTELAAIDARLTDLLGAGDPVGLLDRRKDGLAGARQTVDAGRKAVDRVRSDQDQAIRDEHNAGSKLADMRVTAASVASSLDLVFDPEDGSTPVLAATLENLRARMAVERSRLQEEAETLGAEQVEVAQARGALLAAVEIDGEIDVEITRVGARVEALVVQIATTESDLASADGARQELAAAGERKGRFDRIVSDLTDARFVRFLLDDERIRLAELGSDHFQLLTSGRYRFSDDGTFAIIDLATADVVRKADSLSGGETFLASLALALGLAEMVARSGGRLEAFLLDEGFGTLDPEHLNLAMEGIERLITDGSQRLVVVVSHIPELRERIEDLIELDRHPVTGDTVVLRA